jgi:hypothetical protein
MNLQQNHPHLPQNQNPLVTKSPHIPVVEYNLTLTTLANHQHPIESIACQPRDADRVIDIPDRVPNIQTILPP